MGYNLGYFQENNRLAIKINFTCVKQINIRYYFYFFRIPFMDNTQVEELQWRPVPYRWSLHQ